MAKIDKLIKDGQTHLETGEEIIATVMGAYESKIMGKDTLRTGIFMATQNRIVFFGKKMFGYDLEVFPYSNISSIEMGKGLTGHHIAFFASGNKSTMKWINAGDVEKFVECVKNKIGKKEESQQPVHAVQNEDPTEALRKYAALRDEGIISETDYEAKKKQLLGL